MYYDGGEQLSIEQADVVTALSKNKGKERYRDLDIDPKTAKVVLSNVLLDHMPSFSLNASKLFDSMVASLPSFPQENEEAIEIMERNRFLKIVVTDLVEGWESLNNSNAYEVVKQALAELSSTPFVFEYYDRKMKKHIMSSSFIASYHYASSHGYAEIELSSSFSPYLVSLKNAFTYYKLEYSYRFASINSKRLYELLAQYRSIGTRSFTVQGFKDMLHISDKYKGNNYNLKKKVIECSVQEIQEKTDLNVTYEMKGRGDKATITFSFVEKKNTRKKPANAIPIDNSKIATTITVMVNDLELDKLFDQEELQNLAVTTINEFSGDNYASVKAMMALQRAKTGYDSMIKKGTDIKHPKNYFRTILEAKCDELKVEEEKQV